MERARLGINTMTTRNWSLAQEAEAYARHGIANIGIWESMCGGRSGASVRGLMAAHGLRVSHVCYGGGFTAASAEERARAIEQTRRLIAFTAEAGSDCLLIVAGPIGAHGRAGALGYVRDGIERVLPEAQAHRVRLGLEPIHPMEITQWSVITTVPDALELVDAIGSPGLGVFLDTYHIFWDPRVLSHIARCAGRIAGVHLADWRSPTRSFTDRTVPGRGVVPFGELIAAFEAAGYRGSYDVELFSDELWASDYEALLTEICAWADAV